MEKLRIRKKWISIEHTGLKKDMVANICRISSREPVILLRKGNRFDKSRKYAGKWIVSKNFMEIKMEKSNKDYLKVMRTMLKHFLSDKITKNRNNVYLIIITKLINRNSIMLIKPHE